MRHRTDAQVIIGQEIPEKIIICQMNPSFDTDQCDNLSNPFKEMIVESSGSHDIPKLETGDSFKDANLILYSDYSLIDQNYNSIPFDPKKTYYVYGLSGSDEMANKAALALHMKDKGYQVYIPKTYVLFKASDMMEFAEDSKQKGIYILKKNIQRQEGMMITKDYKYIRNRAAQDGYVVCQELLQNPYLVDGRKINIRIYLLIVMSKDKAEFYIYNNGFMYYTPQKYIAGSMEVENNITTGYIDRKVYEENPLTLQDFYDFLENSDAQKLQINLVKTFQALKTAYAPVLSSKNNRHNIMNFNIFGVDIAPDDSLEIKIIEINKGPDLSYKDERDKQVKYNLVCDCFNLVGLDVVAPMGNPDNFIKI